MHRTQSKTTINCNWNSFKAEKKRKNKLCKKLHERSIQRWNGHRKYEINHIYMQNRFCILCSVRWYLFFLNKYFIISTIIWCYAVYSDSHQNMTTREEKSSGNFYNHMQLHNLFYYNNMMFQRLWGRRSWAGAEGGLRDPMNIEMQIHFLCHRHRFFRSYFDHLWN